MADVSDGPVPGQVTARAGALVQFAGAAVSLALIIGVGVWGYKLWVRDVTGIPVVRAMEGPMREAPGNPGGDLGLHTGLSVNEVAAVGEAAPPEDRLVLAPPVVGLSEDDLMVMPTAEAGEFIVGDDLTGPEVQTNVAGVALPEADLGLALQAVDPVVEPQPEEQTVAIDEAALIGPQIPADVPMTAEQVLALADQIAAGAEPLSDLAEGEAAPVALALDGAAAVEVVPSSVPGVWRALRPAARPETLVVASVTPVTVPPVTVEADTGVVSTGQGTVMLTSATIPVGTNLVQLGAYESPEIAAQEWDRLNARFSAFITGKERIIQEAATGGRTFFRLRAMGFADLADARRFCSALIAEEAACIPVVVR